MSRLRKPNNSVRSSISKFNVDAKVKGTLKVTNKLSSFPPFLVTSNKSYYFVPRSEDLF